MVKSSRVPFLEHFEHKPTLLENAFREGVEWMPEILYGVRDRSTNLDEAFKRSKEISKNLGGAYTVGNEANEAGKVTFLFGKIIKNLIFRAF